MFPQCAPRQSYQRNMAITAAEKASKVCEDAIDYLCTTLETAKLSMSLPAEDVADGTIDISHRSAWIEALDERLADIDALAMKLHGYTIYLSGGVDDTDYVTGIPDDIQSAIGHFYEQEVEAHIDGVLERARLAVKEGILAPDNMPDRDALISMF